MSFSMKAALLSPRMVRIREDRNSHAAADTVLFTWEWFGVPGSSGFKVVGLPARVL